MGAGPPSCTVFRATFLLIHNLSQTPAWSTPGDHRVALILVQSRLRSEHLAQAGAPFPVSTWMKDQPGREKKFVPSFMGRAPSATAHPWPVCLCPVASLPLSHSSRPVGKERLPRPPVLRESGEESKLELVPQGQN